MQQLLLQGHWHCSSTSRQPGLSCSSSWQPKRCCYARTLHQQPGSLHHRRARREGPACRAVAAVAPSLNGVVRPDKASMPALHPTPAKFDSIESALADIAAGKQVVVIDDEERENEGDLIFAADRATPEAVAFMVEHTSGVICVPLPGSECDRLGLPLMVESAENEEAMCTAFTVTVDARVGTSTGISAADRCNTIRALADPSSQPGDFKKPGHIFPLRYREGGVLTRPGHTEAAVDLARLAGCAPAGVLCEVVDRRDGRGDMARTPQLLEFAQEHGLRIITIADLVKYRQQREAAQPASAGGW